MILLLLLLLSCSNEKALELNLLERLYYEQDNPKEIDSFFKKIIDRKETLGVSETIQLFFSREPNLNSKDPILSAFSQGRFPIPNNHDERENLSASQCKSCHKEEYKGWKESLHSKSFTNPRFKAAFQIEPNAWCLNCHAPYWENLTEKKDNLSIVMEQFYSSNSIYTKNITHRNQYQKSYDYSSIETSLNKEGVNCSVCHMRNQTIFTNELTATKSIKNVLFSNHKLKENKSISNSDLCIGCHEFSFPNSVYPIIHYSNHKMQSTVSEYYEAKNSNKENCNSCHFNVSYHGGSGLLNPSEFSKNFIIYFHYKNEKKELQFEIFIPKIGHEFPTGDLFRELQIKAFHEKEEILKYIISKNVEVSTRKILSNNRLLPDKHFSIRKNMKFNVTQIPTRCVVEYHLEGRIDKTVEKILPKRERIINLYDGICEIDSSKNF
ncbi:MAG: multiheme c-type cytochrome [Leptospiraceae bacterium]|nr:multiheme c-type cytochrome [Leptospiraceae bacterium]